jgi:hypothetical protein
VYENIVADAVSPYFFIFLVFFEHQKFYLFSSAVSSAGSWAW